MAEVDVSPGRERPARLPPTDRILPARERLRPRRSAEGSTEIETCLPPDEILTTCPYEEASDDLLALGESERVAERGDATSCSRDGDLDMLRCIDSGDPTSWSREWTREGALDCARLEGGETARIASSFHAKRSAEASSYGSKCLCSLTILTSTSGPAGAGAETGTGS